VECKVERVNKYIKKFSSSSIRGCEYVDNRSEAFKIKGFRKRISLLIIKGQAVKLMWTKFSVEKLRGYSHEKHNYQLLIHKLVQWVIHNPL
jgi:uncharacterized FlgJ-related protein